MSICRTFTYKCDTRPLKKTFLLILFAICNHINLCGFLIKMSFGEVMGTLASVLLLMGVCFWEAFYTVQNYCNAVCIAIILIDASVFIAEGMLMVGAIKCLRGGKKIRRPPTRGRIKRQALTKFQMMQYN